MRTSLDIHIRVSGFPTQISRRIFLTPRTRHLITLFYLREIWDPHPLQKLDFGTRKELFDPEDRTPGKPLAKIDSSVF